MNSLPERAIELIEKAGLIDWDNLPKYKEKKNETREAKCDYCGEFPTRTIVEDDQEIILPDLVVCGAGSKLLGCRNCYPLAKAYPLHNNPKANSRIEGFVFANTKGETHVWTKSVKIHSDSVVSHMTDHVFRDAFRFIDDPANREEPYVFVMSVAKGSLVTHDKVILNVDPSCLYISQAEGKFGITCRDNIVVFEELDRLKSIFYDHLTVDPKTFIDKPIRELSWDEEFTEQLMESCEWKMLRKLYEHSDNNWVEGISHEIRSKQ